MTPQVYTCDQSPSQSPCLVHIAADRQLSSVVQHGVASQPFGSAHTFSPVVCHPPSVVLLVPRLGGLGPEILFMPSATGCDALPLRGLCGSDESCLGHGVADITARGNTEYTVG